MYARGRLLASLIAAAGALFVVTLVGVWIHQSLGRLTP